MPVVRVRTDHRNAVNLFLLQRQQTVILQKDHALSCSPTGQANVSRGIDVFQIQVIIFRLLSGHDSQQEACCKDTHRCGPDCFFINFSFIKSLLQALPVCGACIEVTAVLQSRCGGLFCIRCQMMPGMDIFQGLKVRNEMSLKPPFFPQNALQKRTGAAGFSVHAVVCPHDRLYVRLSDEFSESRQVGFRQVFFAAFGIKTVANGFRTRMNGKVFGAGRRLQMLFLALQPLYKSAPHLACKEGILSVSLMAPPPAGVPENVHIR